MRLLLDTHVVAAPYLLWWLDDSAENRPRWWKVL